MAEKFVEDLLSKYVLGQDYVDVGPLYGTINETLSIAAKFAPKSLTAVDIDPLSSKSWDALRSRLTDLGVGPVREYSANLDQPNIVNSIGTYDFVHSAGILYHVPSPIYSLNQYRTLTRRHLLLGTMIMPDEISNEHGVLSFKNGRMLFVPGLGEQEKKICGAHFDSLGLRIQHINATESWPWRTNTGANYGPWWWLYSAGGCAAMLRVAGFEIISEESTWGGRYHYFFCERSGN